MVLLKACWAPSVILRRKTQGQLATGTQGPLDTEPSLETLGAVISRLSTLSFSPGSTRVSHRQEGETLTAMGS